MLHKHKADELGAHLKKIVDTERKADQIGRRLTVKRGVYLLLSRLVVGVEGMLVCPLHEVCPDANG